MAGALIALTGLKHAGKSEIAKILEKDFGFRRARFASPLKSMLREMLRHAGATEELIERMIEGDLKEEPSPLLGGRSPRHAMQTLGTEWGRKMIHDTLWVDIAVMGIKHLLGMGADVVVEDLRFLNEYEGIVNAGGIVARVIRPGLIADQHQSEQEMAAIRPDYVFENGGTLDDLKEMVHAFLEAG